MVSYRGIDRLIAPKRYSTRLGSGATSSSMKLGRHETAGRDRHHPPARGMGTGDFVHQLSSLVDIAVKDRVNVRKEQHAAIPGRGSLRRLKFDCGIWRWQTIRLLRHPRRCSPFTAIDILTKPCECGYPRESGPREEETRRQEAGRRRATVAPIMAPLCRVFAALCLPARLRCCRSCSTDWVLFCDTLRATHYNKLRVGAVGIVEANALGNAAKQL